MTSVTTVPAAVEGNDVSDALLFEFTGVSADDYNAVNEILGLDPATRSGEWPAGLLSHTAAVTPGGGFIVFEVWDSKESQEAWAARLGPALDQAAVPAPTRVEWLSIVGQYNS